MSCELSAPKIYLGSKRLARHAKKERMLRETEDLHRDQFE